jgi:hypothetical protein
VGVDELLDGPVGRPGADMARRDVRLGLRVSTRALAAIDALAAKEHRTRSDMVRVLLRRGLDNS